MRTLFTIIFSTLLTLGVLAYLFFFYPLFSLDIGSITLTQIASTDSLSGFPTTYNANLTAINAGKMDTATTSNKAITTMSGLTTATSLASIGTVTSGTWNGTTIAVANGGTGSTTLTQYRVLLGNGTSAIWEVASAGTSGQFLTSQGASARPIWTTSSVDLAGTYAWTGTHSFTDTGTTTHTRATSSFNGMHQDGIYGGIVPTGAILWYTSSTTPPAGWLECDGSAVSRSTYNLLFAILGTNYGDGDGSTTFNLPDVRDRGIIMASSTNAYDQKAGESSHTLTTAELAAHSHTHFDYTTGSGPGGASTNSSIGTANGASTANAGGGKEHNVRDPYIAMGCIIKY